MAMHPARARVGFRGPCIQGRGPVYGFFKGGGHASEFGDVVAPLGADSGFAMPRSDAAKEILDKRRVMSRIGVGDVVDQEWSTGGHAGHGARCWRRVLLLEIYHPFRGRGWLDPAADLDAAGGHVAQNVPPFWMVGKGRVGHPGHKAGHIQQVVNFRQIRVRKGMSGKAPENTTGSERAGREHRFGHFARWPIVAEEDDTFLSQEGVDENDNGVRVGAIGGQVGVECKGLRGGGIGTGEDLDELNDGKIANGFWRYGGGHFDRDGNLVVYDSGFEFVSIAWYGVSGALARWLEGWFGG